MCAGNLGTSQVPTDKGDISDYGPLADVVLTLADKVLTAPSQEVKIVAAAEVGEQWARNAYYSVFVRGRVHFERGLLFASVGKAH